MPSGPESFVSHPSYIPEFTHARELLLGHPGRWRIIYHYDGDGIASASSAIRALQRLGYASQASPLVGVEKPRMAELLGATKGPVLIVDTGASWLDLAAAHSAPVIVLDHHKFPPPATLPAHVAFVNPLNWGVDGMSELCAATLTWLFTIHLDPKNWDNAPFGLSGAIADRQHVGGFRGLNAKLVEEAQARSLVVRRSALPLFGSSVADALSRSIDPYFTGLSGRLEEARRLLDGLGIDPSRPVLGVTPAEERRLTNALVARMVHQGTRPEFRDILTQDRWTLPTVGMDAQELSNLQNATGRIGEPGVGIALALGDPEALARARHAEETWRTGVLTGLRRIEDGGVNSRGAVQWFESPETTLAGTQAGLAMNYLVDSKRPLFVFSEGEGTIKVSGRGTQWLVSQGLDLSVVCRDAALSVQGEGGGHRVASGATIPPGARDPFLNEADRLVQLQLRIAPAEAAP
ncbi:MAG: DHH family phosphoesterase [Thermoplasmata archaeon]|nr:DHH family phosphoesterase [Thermoplasmata archaeon]